VAAEVRERPARMAGRSRRHVTDRTQVPSSRVCSEQG
jgi:hypothetical protein